jgi:hypothetical protein
MQACADAAVSRRAALQRSRARRLAALFVPLAGCAGGIEDPARFPPPECPIRAFDARDDLLAARCAGAECHVGEAPAAGLDLVSAGVAERLLDVPSSCGGAPLVDTSSPGASVLLDRVRAVPQCGAPMPLGGPPLDAVERACLEAWVRQIAEGGTP